MDPRETLVSNSWKRESSFAKFDVDKEISGKNRKPNQPGVRQRHDLDFVTNPGGRAKKRAIRRTMIRILASDGDGITWGST
jgi:hypothetical protein